MIMSILSKIFNKIQDILNLYTLLDLVADTIYHDDLVIIVDSLNGYYPVQATYCYYKYDKDY